jgi:hypothetical protein
LNEPRDERDFKVELELKTPEWLSGVRLAASFRRLWDKRVRDYTNKAVGLAGVDMSKLESRLGEGGKFADLFLEGARRVVENGDDVLCDTVTRLVAAALRDSALIHDASYLMKKFSTLDALHIRVIYAIPVGEPPAYLVSSQEPLSTEARVSADVGWFNEVLEFSIENIASKCLASKPLVRAAVGELEATGFTAKSSVLQMQVDSALISYDISKNDVGTVEGLGNRTGLLFKKLGFESIERLARMAKGGQIYMLTELGACLRGLIEEIDEKG